MAPTLAELTASTPLSGGNAAYVEWLYERYLAAPESVDAHWRDLFDYYVFNNGDDVTAHIPEHGRSVLAPLTPESADRIRAFLLRNLSQ